MMSARWLAPRPFRTAAGRGTLAVALLVTCAVTATLISGGTAAAVSPKPIFTVTNTDEAAEAAPDGVWFRNSSHAGDTDRITGLGVFRGDRVELACYTWGDAMGGHDNRLWYLVRNVSRPTVSGKSNQGYLNGHYIDDGRKSNQVDSRVHFCGSSVFYSGTDTAEGVKGTTVADKNLGLGDWAPGNCDTSKVVSNTPRGATVLSGWSKGRLGIVYFLLGVSPERKAAVHTIILFDPGAISDMKPQWWRFWRTSCDQRLPVATLLADWLKSDDRNRLVMLAGKDTENAGSDGKPTFAGIKQFYLAKMQDTSFSDRALVCVYHNLGHADVLTKLAGFAEQPMLDCPAANGAPAPTSWHP